MRALRRPTRGPPDRGAILLGRCRRAAARERETRRASLAPNPAENPCEDAARRAHASQAALRRLEDRLDELARGLHSADGRLMARVMRDALHEGEDRG